MYIWFSLWDFLSVLEIRKWVERDDLASFYEFLYRLGYNLDEDIEFEASYHRTLDNTIVFCPRVIGRERTDEEYLESGLASDEAWKISVGKYDPTLLREIEEMSKTKCFTQALTEHLEDYWGSGGADKDIEITGG